jgi:DNA-binding NarL/FixJ family response regulator
MPAGRPAPVTLGILDPNEISLRGIAAGLRRDRRFRIIAATTDVGPSALTAAVLSSDALLVDPVVAGKPQTDVLPRLLAAGCAVIVHSDYFEPQFFLSAVLSTVRGYIAKSGSSVQRLADFVWAIVRHHALVVDGRFADYFWAGPEERVVLFAPHDSVPDLTGRQREIIGALAAGLSDGEIALRLGVSLSTVQTHILNVERKLGATSRFDLALKAVRAGLINPSTPVLS